MARTPDPEPGQRIRVTHADEDWLIGATGVIAEVHDHAIEVGWDDHRINQRGMALLRGADRWEVVPPDAADT